jgi:hypothetical protein
MIRSISELPAPPQIERAIRFIPPGSRHEGRCVGCCHWSVPLAFTAKPDVRGVLVAMEYEAWILWHAHVLLHQRAELQS